MNSDKYSRSISLLCSTCGCTQFSYDDDLGEAVQVVTCTSCGREFNKNELIHENSENIHEHLSEVKKDIEKDFASEMRKTLKKALSGNKNIRFK